MKVFKRGAILVCMLLITLLAACTTNEVKTDDLKKVKTTSTEIENIPPAPRTVEEMIEQKAGVLVEKYMEDQQLETLGGWDGKQYLNFVDKTFNPIIEKELTSYFTKNKNLTGEQVYDYLVYMLRSGNYKNYYEQLVSYDHGFVMPELPSGEDEVSTKQKKMNVVVLMDASGSMKGQIAGKTKMELAKAAIARFVDQIPVDANVALISYGHVGSSSESDKMASCSAVESMYSLSSYKAENFTNALNSFQAKGWTPLAGAINKAGELLQAYPADEYLNLVYMVSDGIETCDGDPVAAAQLLQSQNIKAKVNIIGFDVDNEGQKQLKQVAESGGGEYVTVNDPTELEVQITKKWQPSIGQLVWTQGVTMQQWLNASERMNSIYNPLYQASNAEMHRIKNAAYFLNDNDFITDEVEKQVLDLADSLEALRSEHFKQVKEEKISERDRAEKEIKDKVNEWKQQWEND